jgi:hypothetical protein
VMRIIGIVSRNAHPAGNQAPEEDVGIPDASRHIGTNPAKQSQMSGIKGVKTIGN